MSHTYIHCQYKVLVSYHASIYTCSVFITLCVCVSLCVRVSDGLQKLKVQQIAMQVFSMAALKSNFQHVCCVLFNVVYHFYWNKSLVSAPFFEYFVVDIAVFCCGKFSLCKKCGSLTDKLVFLKVGLGYNVEQGLRQTGSLSINLLWHYCRGCLEPQSDHHIPPQRQFGHGR